ncbi:uncharacterized protein BP5553_00879 [Venustampulla echinocandica]|uniref:Uncharacterized protein n=1 Tax=Venustampulla echinocandica TaxID=2656787 RepID=A0A370TZG3_9HELO|nr:uncharacterized protein BP5553_00879 [Venustampulla echinocandica]RDL40900.1 hypothetical protein BP5553_00879 [Venustampulla echinocandica]
MASGPGYNPVSTFSPFGDEPTVYQSPATYSQQWNPPHGDLGHAGIEMSDSLRPQAPIHQDQKGPEYSTAPTLFSNARHSGESQSFLHDPANRLDTTYNAHHVPYKDHTGRQFRHILIGMSTRWFITAGLCAAYIFAIIWWHNRGPQSETQKRLHNALTTAVSIALGLNVASAFKDVALNMRWVILSTRRRTLVELDLVLNADSLMKLGELAFSARRPAVVVGCVLWLLINILAQVGIAVLSLTYGWEVDYSGVLMKHGNVSIPDMSQFFPQNPGSKITLQDEEYAAHLYGALGANYGLNYTDFMPKAGDIYDNNAASIWYSNKTQTIEFIFADSPTGAMSAGQFSIYTDRKVSVTWKCEAHEVTEHGDGSSSNITVAQLGDVYVSRTVPDAMTIFTNTSAPGSNVCGPRCSVVEAFESSGTDPWYYRCNITVGKTVNDPRNISYISDSMASIATTSIAEIGYTDHPGQEAQIYPHGSVWGAPLKGSVDEMGLTIACYALGSIAGAAFFNPSTSYVGMAPSAGQCLVIGHPIPFYTVVGLICGCHLLFVVITAVLSNRVKVGPDTHLNMSLLLRPIADALHGVGSGRKNTALKDAKKSTYARYEKTPNGRWVLSMT